MLETDRLLIRQLGPDDLESIYGMRSDEEVMRFIRSPQSIAESKRWIELVSSRWESEGIGFCAVIFRETGEFAGWCGLWKLQETDEIEVGYAIAKRFWKRGFALEAARAMLGYGFGELGLEKIVAVAREPNSASRRVMERLGMQFDYKGRFYSSELVHYSISRAEFLAQDLAFSASVSEI